MQLSPSGPAALLDLEPPRHITRLFLYANILPTVITHTPYDPAMSPIRAHPFTNAPKCRFGSPAY
jgi:hypothetical protein